MNLWDRIHTTPAPVPLGRVEAFDVSNTLAAILQRPQDEFPCSWPDLPNVAPPFQTYFMFGTLPKYYWAGGEVHELPRGEIGALFDAQKIPTGWSVVVRLVGGDPVAWQDTLIAYRVRANGRMDVFDHGKMFEVGYPIARVPDLIAQRISPEDFVGDLSSHIYPYAFATTLLHCKNVRATRVHLPPKLVAARLRRGHATYSYSVLDIQSLRRSLATEKTLPSGASLHQALHVCRGHFKDYQDGAGLFGRHKGIYWWEDMVRGSVTEGVHVKDYRIRD